MSVDMAVFLYGVLMVGAGYAACYVIHKKPHYQPVDEPAILETEELVIEQPEPIAPFVVSGKPKKPSIAQRKKELREAAKTKRKKMEEWRD